MKYLNTLLTASAMTLLLSCGQKQTYEYPFQNPKLSNEERVENLISLLTPDEKVAMMMNKTASIDRLGIPSYNWWSEACHGIVKDGYTVYPQNIGLGATFDPDLVYDVFTTVSDEARAHWNTFERPMNVTTDVVNYPDDPGLSYWCPNVNIFRDPRWGRGQETCGEDPYLTSVLGIQTVKGMQGNDKRYFKTHACAKHYAVHSGPEPLRHTFDVTVSMKDLWETYLPAFKALVVDANVQEVMCAYHRYEGVPCCTNDRLLHEILRNKWGYKSLVVTDCDAINNFYTKGQHETHPDAIHASIDALLNGTDLECGRNFRTLYGSVEKGIIKESELDSHLRILLTGMMELGIFDPLEMSPWKNLGPEDISSEAHDALARKAAQESMVLLKNDGILPLSKSVKKIAVVGPNADNVDMLNGNYGGTPTDNHKRSILAGIKAAVPGAEVIYSDACQLMDEYNTVSHLKDFNGGKGLKADFYGGRSLSGAPVKSEYFDKTINFSTFGAYAFSEGVNADEVAVRLSGSIVPDFSGSLKYNISSDNGYKLIVNGKTVDKTEASATRGFGRRNAVPDYKEIKVEAGKTYNVEVEYVRGNGPFAMLSAQFCERNLADFAPLAEQVKDCDAIIVVGGITSHQEGEGGDRADMEFPMVQQRLVRAMHETGKPVILVNCSGSAMAFAPIEDQYNALIQAWYGGQAGAYALADIIFGDCNPSAKLPVTFYASTSQLPDFQDYNMDNHTYRYFHGTPLYPFGYGLSYTTFEIAGGKLSKKSVKAGQGVDITVSVSNTGKVDGTEVVQVYVKSLDNPEAPIKSLKGFQRVELKAGQNKSVKIALAADAFSFYDESIDGLSPKAGKYQILYGDSSADKDLKALDLEVL